MPDDVRPRTSALSPAVAGEGWGMGARTLRSAEDLIAVGLVVPGSAPALAEVAARYAIAVTPVVAALMNAGDPADPIALQYIPDPAELLTAPGTARFRVPEAEGLALVRGLRGRVSGLAQPAYVRETAGGGGKVVVG